MSKETRIREIISENIRLLADKRGWSQTKLAHECGVAQRTINKTINLDSSPTADTIERIAHRFGMAGWQLMLPGFCGDPSPGPPLEKLVEHYLLSSKDGQNYISRIAEKEAHYEVPSERSDSTDVDIAGAGGM